ncbi:MAG: Fic/DOC family protein, partial [Acinetobacter sp.]
MTENSNEDANNEFYEEAREILNEPVRTRAQKEFNKELEYSITKARTAKLDKEPILGNYDKVHLSKIHEVIFRRLYDYAGK